MHVDYAGSPEIAAPTERVWRCLMDHEFLAGCSRHVEAVEPLDDLRYRVISAIKVGFFKFRFALNVELSDLQPFDAATMTVRGKAPGSELSVRSRVRLESLAPEVTRVEWSAVASIDGLAAAVGAPLFSATTRRVTDDFWREFVVRAAA